MKNDFWSKCGREEASVDYFEEAQKSWLGKLKELKALLEVDKTKETLEQIDLLIYELEGDLEC